MTIEDAAEELDTLAAAVKMPLAMRLRGRVAERIQEIAASLRKPLELAGIQPARKEP